jgi:protein-tyrosine phosphatase
MTAIAQPQSFRWIDAPRGEHLAIAPRPRGGDWLDDEILAWKRDGVDVVVSLLEIAETQELSLDSEARSCRAAGIAFESFPIADRSVPRSAEMMLELANRIQSLLASGNGVLIHCRVGIGRSALIAAVVLVRSGIDADEAFARIARARGTAVPDTEEQREWVRQFAASRP